MQDPSPLTVIPEFFVTVQPLVNVYTEYTGTQLVLNKERFLSRLDFGEIQESMRE